MHPHEITCLRSRLTRILPIDVKSLTIDTNQLQGKHFTHLGMNSMASTLQDTIINHGKVVDRNLCLKFEFPTFF